VRYQLLTADTAGFMQITGVEAQADPDAMQTVVVPQMVLRDTLHCMPTMFCRKASSSLGETEASFDTDDDVLLTLSLSQLQKLNKLLASESLGDLLTLKTLKQLGCSEDELKVLRELIRLGEDEFTLITSIVRCSLSLISRWRLRALRKAIAATVVDILMI
jgi:hypothetical protein